MSAGPSSTKADLELMAKTLRFLASGFEMAGQSGVPGELRAVTSVSLPAAEQVSVRWADDKVRMGSFSAMLPFAFLLDAIGVGSGEATYRGDVGSISGRDGWAVRDYGSETYRLRQVDLRYAEMSDGFRMNVTMRIGEPDTSSFLWNAPCDRTQEVFDAHFCVPWRTVFKFLFVVTQDMATAIVARIEERAGIRVDLPTFFVSN